MSSPRIASRFARDIAGWYGDVGRRAEKEVLTEAQKYGREAGRFGSPDIGGGNEFLSGALLGKPTSVDYSQLSKMDGQPYGFPRTKGESGFTTFNEQVNEGRFPGFDMHSHPPLRSDGSPPDTQADAKSLMRHGVSGPLAPSGGDFSVWLRHYDPVHGMFRPRPEIKQTAYIQGSQPRSLLAMGSPDFNEGLLPGIASVTPADLYKIMSGLNDKRSDLWRDLKQSQTATDVVRDYSATLPELWAGLHTDRMAKAGVPMTFEDLAPFGKGWLQDAMSDFYKTSDRRGEGFQEGGPVEMGDGGGVLRKLLNVFHGSPHAFKKFDPTKIGSGEGAQAYGYGHYFAGNEDVARGYRDKLTARNREGLSPKFMMGDKEIDISELPRDAHKFWSGYGDEVFAPGLSYEQLMDRAQDIRQNAYQIRQGSPLWERAVDRGQALVDFLDANKNFHIKSEIPKGHMYDVTLGVNPEHLLNWDAPVAQQPAFGRVVDSFGGGDALMKRNKEFEGLSNRLNDLYDSKMAFGSSFPPERAKLLGGLQDEFLSMNKDPLTKVGGLASFVQSRPDIVKGGEFYKRLSEVDASRSGVNDRGSAASGLLQSLDIPGIRYLDGFSRNAGEGTSNYVMFPGTEDLININRRYEQGGPVNTPTEGEGGLYAAPNSTFDTPPPYDWGYRPGGAHADGGPVEMQTGGPSLIKRGVGYLRSSRLGDLKDEITSMYGGTQGRRFEQAADSADLERFSDDALRKTFDRSDTGLYTTMPPGDFEKFADPISPSVLDKVPYYKLGYRDLAGSLPESQQSYDAYIRILQGLSERGGLSSVPDLRISDREGPYKSIRGHEGRHRMRMLDRAGEQDALVHLIPENYGLFDGRVDRLMGRYFPYGNNTPFMPEASHMSPGDESRPVIQFPRPVFEEGGPVEMATGGTTPTSTGGQYQPRESEGPGFFRNQDNYDNSSAGDINFVKNFVQGLSPAQREAQRLVSEATRKSGKEALVFGRGENPNDLAKLTQGTYENVSIPGNYAQYALQSADPFYSFHTHATNTLSPSAADLRIWGATQPGTIGLPYQSMFINASPQDSLLRIGEPGKWMDSDAQRLVQEVLNLKNKNEDLVANHGFMDPRMREFWKSNKLPDLAHTFHAESDQMPGVKSYLDKKIPGAAQGASMRDLYAGNFLQRIAELGIPVDVSAEHRIAGTPYLAQDVWPEFAAHVKKHALPKAEGGPVEMSRGGQDNTPSGGGYIRNNLEDMYAGDPTQAIRGGVRTKLARQHQMDTPKGKAAPPDPRIQTVRDPERMVYPGIYKDPDVIAEEASKRLMRDYGKDGPMYRLFGQTRSSLDELSQGRDLEGMRPWPLRQAYTPPGGSTGASVSDQVLTPRNATRLLDIHGEAMKYPGLRETRSWYEMSPLYQRMEELGIPLDEQRLFNQRTGIFSAAASPVSEINRGTLAHHLAQQGRIEDFIKYGGVAEKNRASILGFPEDIMDMKSHAYHGTAQAPTLAEIEMSGGYWPKEHKVGTYIGATDPVFPNYTRPIADSHIARGVGYADVRPGKLANVKANLSNPEYTDFYPWWENKIAGQTGLRPRDEQAFMWNVLGPQTGVRYIGPSKLELMSNQMMKASKRLGVAPDVARDMVLRGEAGAYKEGGTVEDQYHPIWQQSFAGGGQPEEEPRGYFAPQYSAKQRAAIARQQNAERLAEITAEANANPGAYWRDLLTQIPRGAASIAELPGLVGDIMNLRADYLDSVAPGSSPTRIPHWGTSESISQGIDSLFPTPTTKHGAAAGRELGEMSLNALGLGIANNAGRVARSLGHVGNIANLASILGGGPGGDMEPTEQQPPSEPSYAYEQFLRSQDPSYRAFEAERPFYGMAQGGHAKDTGNTFDFLGPFGAGLNIIADGIGALGGEDFELDKALGYLGEIGGSLVAPGIGGALGRGAGEAAAHIIEPGEGDVGRDALNAGYGALRGGMGMFMAHGGSTGSPFDDDQQDNLTPFLSPTVNPSVQPDPMDWAAANGIPGAVAPPLNRGNDQRARDAAERQRLMQMAEGASKQALQSQSGGGKGGGGGGMGDLTQIASMAMKFLPMMMAAEGGPVPAPDGEQPWMYGDGALMARGGYLRGCGGMNG